MFISPSDKQKAIDLITVLLPAATIYLFGSQARGTATRSSDVDIALDTGAPIDFGIMAEIKDVLAATNIPQSFDVVDIHMVPKEMRDSILKEGKVWKK